MNPIDKTESQRAAIAAELANLRHGSNQFEKKEETSFDASSTDDSAMTIDKVADQLGVSPSSIDRAKRRMVDDPEAHDVNPD